LYFIKGPLLMKYKPRSGVIADSFLSTLPFPSLFKFLLPGWRWLAGQLLVLSCLLPQVAWAQTPPTFDMAVRVLTPFQQTVGLAYCDDVAVDAAGNSYISGQFRGSVRFDNRTIIAPTGLTSTYIAKIDATGAYRWIVSLNAGSTGVGYGMSGVISTNLAVDTAGNLIVAGDFAVATLTLGGTTLTNAGGSDLFVAKLDANGNWLSAVRAGGPSNEEVRGLALDSSNNAYLTG
jgi:hypothetical protein